MLLLGCRSEVKALTILKRCAKGNLSLTGNLFIGMGKTNLETFEGLFFLCSGGRILYSSNKHISFHCYLHCSLIILLHS